MKPGCKKEFPYKPARLVESDKEPYVIYYVWDVQKKALVRKRISLDGNKLVQKRRDAAEAIQDINQKLNDRFFDRGIHCV